MTTRSTSATAPAPKTADFKTPKYLRLAGELREQVERGALRPGDRLPSFSEMRARFGATPTTVERIYALLEREGLIVRERGRGTFVALPRERAVTGVIGVSGVTFALRQHHPYWAHLMEGMQRAASHAERELLLLNESSSIMWEKVDGVIACGKEGQEALRRLPPGMPGVSALLAARGVVSVVADEYGGAREATEHLLSLGHQRIAGLFDPLSPRRLDGYRDALREAGIRFDARRVREIGDNPQLHYKGAGRAILKSWLGAGWREAGCTALMVQNDDAAIGAVEALREAELRVPEDVSVIGFDGTEVGEHFTPRLTTVQVPLDEIGATAVETLLQQMNGEKIAAARLVLSTHLQVRDSTAPPAKTT